MCWVIPELLRQVCAEGNAAACFMVFAVAAQYATASHCTGSTGLRKGVGLIHSTSVQYPAYFLGLYSGSGTLHVSTTLHLHVTLILGGHAIQPGSL